MVKTVLVVMNDDSYAEQKDQIYKMDKLGVQLREGDFIQEYENLFRRTRELEKENSEMKREKTGK